MTTLPYLSPTFLERIMQQHAPDKAIRVLDCQPLPIDNSASILVTLTAGRSEKQIGHFGLLVTYESAGQRHTRPMVMKIKPHGNDIVAMLTSLAQANGEPLASVYPAYQHRTGFQHTHQRELTVYAQFSSDLQPEIFGLYADPAQDVYLILMEYLQEVELLNTVMTPAAWSDRHIRQALGQLAVWHAQHLDQRLPGPAAGWDDVPSRTQMQELSPLWDALLQNAADKLPGLYTPDRVQRLHAIRQQIPTYWLELERMPHTLIHNDLNPRNTCFKTTTGALTFCVYDWELATCHVPQYDVIELLCFVLDTDRYALRPVYLDVYRAALHQLTGRYADPVAFRRGAELAAFDFGLHRLGLYLMAHALSPYPFLPRVVDSYFNTLEQLQTR